MFVSVIARPNGENQPHSRLIAVATVDQTIPFSLHKIVQDHLFGNEEVQELVDGRGMSIGYTYRFDHMLTNNNDICY